MKFLYMVKSFFYRPDIKKNLSIMSCFILSVTTVFFFTACDVAFITSSDQYPADGISSGSLTIKNGSNPIITGDAARLLKIEKNLFSQTLFFQSSGKPGPWKVESSGKTFIVTFYETLQDADADGFPDSAELAGEDREAFRLWFVRIAESLYARRSDYWKNDERDCSGLIRFAYREALKKHDDSFQKRLGLILDKNLPDIKKFHYPAVPLLGTKIFRTGEKSFDEFADAKSLMMYHTKFIGRDLQQALPGDLLFFILPEQTRFPYHSMIFIKHDKNDAILLYHTGDQDIMKLAPASYLKDSLHFRPSASNPGFAGVFRFHILE